MNNREWLIVSIFSLTISILAVLLISELKEKEKPHHHVKAAHFITSFKSVPVTWCYTEDKIVAHNGEHIPIKVPVVLYPSMEEAE